MIDFMIMREFELAGRDGMRVYLNCELVEGVEEIVSVEDVSRVRMVNGSTYEVVGGLDEVARYLEKGI